MSPGLVLLLEVPAPSHHMGFFSIAPPVTHIHVPKLLKLLQAAALPFPAPHAFGTSVGRGARGCASTARTSVSLPHRNSQHSFAPHQTGGRGEKDSTRHRKPSNDGVLLLTTLTLGCKYTEYSHTFCYSSLIIFKISLSGLFLSDALGPAGNKSSAGLSF